MLGMGINDEFFDAYETGILVCYDEMYAEKRDRHKEPYFRHLAESIRKRFPGIRQAPEEMAEKLKEKKEVERSRRFNDFLTRQKEAVQKAERRLRKNLSRKNKKEKVEP